MRPCPSRRATRLATAQAGLVMQPGKRGPALTRPCSSRTGSRTAGCSRPMPVGQRLGAGQPITRLLPTTAATGSTARVHGGTVSLMSLEQSGSGQTITRPSRRPGGQQGRGVFRLRVGGAVGYAPALRPRSLAQARQVTRLWTAPGPRRCDGREGTWARGQVVVRLRGSRANWGGAAAVTPPSASAASGRFWGRGKAAGHAAYATQARGLGGGAAVGQPGTAPARAGVAAGAGHGCAITRFRPGGGDRRGWGMASVRTDGTTAGREGVRLRSHRLWPARLAASSQDVARRPGDAVAARASTRPLRQPGDRPA